VFNEFGILFLSCARHFLKSLNRLVWSSRQENPTTNYAAMRKVILSVAISLDGFIEGPKGEYDWCPPPSSGQMAAFLKRIDVVFYGRKSFELAGAGAFPGKTHYVFSNTLKHLNSKSTYIISGDIVSRVNEIKAESGKDIWLFGGASLTTTFMNEGLVDEMWLGIVPVVLGSGKPLFREIRSRNYFDITEASNEKGYLSVTLRRKPA
jgi:dihydrofolate reductase